MANFDESKWYQISNGDGGLSLVGTPTVITDNTTVTQPYGSVFLRISNSSDIEQQWQFFPVNSSTYALRTRASGPDNFLRATIDFGNGGEVNGGNTKPVMANYTIDDDSMFWKTGTWKSGQFWLENVQNGTGWHLNSTGAFFQMSSNITEPQNTQRFQFKAIEAIDDDRYSSIKTPSASSTATLTVSSSATAAASSTSTSTNTSPHKGLSTAAAAAIGATLGGVFLIAVVVGLLWYRRKRRQRRDQPVDSPYVYDAPVQEISSPPPPPPPPPAELPGVSDPAELGSHSKGESEKDGK